MITRRDRNCICLTRDAPSQTSVSGSTLSVRDEVMSRMTDLQSAKEAVAAAEAACTTGSPKELAALDAAQRALDAAGTPLSSSIRLLRL